EQNDQLLQLEAQATRAQLAMLRYQLNPHFLFNTLNSISTLVLLRQTEPANAMLSRLSSFLRHTLINEVHSRVTLAQEVETLHLYLDIEKMRFEERLRPHFDIDPAVCDALLPSLLLQPLVENAIKYAVTTQEEGADISISAHLEGGKLHIIVSDTGPGKMVTTTSKSDSTGVGLGNIQERLNQAYGEGAIFETRSSPGEGFSVFIALPFETREQIEREAADRSATNEQLRNETIFGEHASSDDHQGEPVNAPAMASFQHKDLKT
ncbi:MAG: histidine kinase, partial [Sphingomonadales bacterium]|nr:histidine kinase [Sphingomonadales bacterium]